MVNCEGCRYYAFYPEENHYECEIYGETISDCALFTSETEYDYPQYTEE